MATENTKISYIKIPDQISYIVNINENIEEAKTAIKNNENITCIILDGNSEKSQTAIDILENLRNENKNLKIAWFCYRDRIPYKAELLDYIKTKDALYLHTPKNGLADQFVDITKFIETTNSLNPMDPFYFEKFSELKNKL